MKLDQYIDACDIDLSEMAAIAGISMGCLQGIIRGGTPSLPTAIRIHCATDGAVSYYDYGVPIPKDIVAPHLRKHQIISTIIDHSRGSAEWDSSLDGVKKHSYRNRVKARKQARNQEHKNSEEAQIPAEESVRADDQPIIEDVLDELRRAYPDTIWEKAEDENHVSGGEKIQDNV